MACFVEMTCDRELRVERYLLLRPDALDELVVVESCLWRTNTLKHETRGGCDCLSTPCGEVHKSGKQSSQGRGGADVFFKGEMNR